VKITVLVLDGRVELGSYDAQLIEFMVRPVNSFSKSLYSFKDCVFSCIGEPVVQELLLLQFKGGEAP